MTYLRYVDLPLSVRGFTIQDDDATLLYDADIGVKEAQALLGHSSARVTMDIYTHLSAQKKSSAAEKLNTFLSSLGDNSETKSS